MTGPARPRGTLWPTPAGPRGTLWPTPAGPPGKLHFLNPVPIRLIHDRWIDKYTEGPAALLASIKQTLEDGP